MDEERNLNPTDAQEQFELAQAYYFGRGLAQDFTKALYWYEKAASKPRKPSEAAMAELGRVYYLGVDVEKDEETRFIGCRKSRRHPFTIKPHSR